MKLLTVTNGPTWPGHAALPAAGTQVGTIRFRPLQRLADGTGATIGELSARIVVGAGDTLVLKGAGDTAFKLPGSDREDGSPRAPRYEVREALTIDGRDAVQTFTIEPYEMEGGPANTWDYRSPRWAACSTWGSCR
ncbi:hypothetical protein [Deinococcus multiflagellatus]|uniref:Uncharacterized protein n=1 Tax=Deinococcus multiflagellatus TaxID=1656887 RepID=A0ABW1ZET5_9DEIO